MRAGLVALLASEPTVVGGGGDGREAVELVGRLRPRPALLGLRMPVLDGASATAAIAATRSATRALVLTTYDTGKEIERAVEAGAIGSLLKDTTREQLVDAIHSASRGETVLAPRVTGRPVARMRRPAPVTLTARETEVPSAAADGLSTMEIGRRLVITEATVKTHLLRLSAELGADDRTRADATALERGLPER
ncbi:response regulator transcription factor [Kitasatospora sp. NPDC093102]|uniref:response regulator transcription factor n=1 Tax=Kitasatospora sp. NPDC093102 TaxID=3155069 RepID=UPI00342DB1F3